MLSIPESVLNKSSPEPMSGCWLWTGATFPNGYGTLKYHKKPWLAHRFFYTALRGPIPDGWVIDHLCRNRSCVNPDHMQIVTQWENNARGAGISAMNLRKTHCSKGHPLSGSNLYRYKKRRSCRRCRNSASIISRRNRNLKEKQQCL